MHHIYRVSYIIFTWVLYIIFTGCRASYLQGVLHYNYRCHASYLQGVIHHIYMGVIHHIYRMSCIIFSGCHTSYLQGAIHHIYREPYIIFTWVSYIIFTGSHTSYLHGCHIWSFITKNNIYQELYSPRTHTSRGQSVLHW